MADDWFRMKEIEVAESGSGKAIKKPDFHGHEVRAYSAQKRHPDGSPNLVVHVYAGEDTLSSLADESGVVRLDGVPKQALDAMTSTGSRERSEEEWDCSMGFDDRVVR